MGNQERLCLPFFEQLELTAEKKKIGETEVEVVKNNWECIECGKLVSFEVGKGFSNPHSHLMTQVDKSKEKLEMVCNDLLCESHGSNPRVVRSQARAKFANEIEQTLFDWIDLIVMHILPLSSVKNSRLKRFCEHKVTIGIQKPKETILQQVMLVE